jgi:iron(III) transport system permease protein
VPIAPPPALLAVPILFLLAAGGAFPLGLLLWQSLGGPEGLTLHAYAVLLTSPASMAAVWNTVLLSGLVMAGSMVVGAALSWLLTCTDLPRRTMWRTLLVTGYIDFVPPLIGTIGWILLLNPRVGYVNSLFQSLLGVETGPFDVFTLGGLVWITTLYGYPFVSLAVERALGQRDQSLQDEARLSGANRWQIARHAVLPSILPAMLVSGLVAFGWAAASFGIAILVGSPAGIYVLSTRILSALQTGGNDAFGETMALSGVLLALGLGVGMLGNWLARRSVPVAPPAPTVPPRLVSLGRWRGLLVALLTVAACLTLVLPVGALVLTSLLRVWEPGLNFANLTLEHYEYVLLHHHLTAPGLLNSLLLGAGSATIAIGLGTVLTSLRRARGAVLLGSGTLASVLVWLPSAAPPTVFALAMILAFSGQYGLNLYGTFAILLIACAAKDVAAGQRSAAGTLGQVDRSLEEEMRLVGASPWWAWRRLFLPLVRPGLIAGWLLVFIPAFREISLSIILYGPYTATAGVALYELQLGGYYQSAAALSVLMLLVVGAANIGARRVISHASRG